MLIKNNTIFRIDDIYENKDEITFFTNKKPDFNILRQSKTLEMKYPLTKTAKVIKVAPKEDDFLYVRNRAISAGNVIENPDGTTTVIDINDIYKFFDKYASKIRGANSNGDFFTDFELKNHYKTFIGKPAFVDHDNENIENARGVIIDAIYNDKGNFIELLKAVDKKAYPELANGILRHYITDTSMGCKCSYSICSICGNKAQSEEDFCEHIVYYKGSTFNNLPVWEDNRDIEFFEDSFVTQGADPDAKIMEKVASKNYIPIQRLGNNKKYDNITKETNQRFYDNRVETFANKLKEIPWN